MRRFQIDPRVRGVVRAAQAGDPRDPEEPARPLRVALAGRIEDDDQIAQPQPRDQALEGQELVGHPLPPQVGVSRAGVVPLHRAQHPARAAHPLVVHGRSFPAGRLPTPLFLHQSRPDPRVGTCLAL